MSEVSLLLKVRRSLPPANAKAELEKAAKESGVPLGTLLKIVSGKTENPRIKTVEKLLRWRSRQ
jgi:predicted transcriptional regulator